MALTAAAALAAAVELVDRFAPLAPAATRAAAAEMVSPLIVAANSSKQIGFGSQTIEKFDVARSADLLRKSGAVGLLAQWRQPRARSIGARP